MLRVQTTAFLMLCTLLMSGCTSSQYVGVQISSTAPLSFTRVLVNGNSVVVCQIKE